MVADALSPRHYQYALATDEQTNRQTSGCRYRLKPPLCGGGLKTWTRTSSGSSGCKYLSREIAMIGKNRFRDLIC